jgi:hypothetical protein
MAMRTALDLPEDGLDDRERVFLSNIREHGWFGVHVPADEEGPGFAFTSGFWVNAGHAELILFSINNDVAQAVFWDLFRDAQRGERLPVGRRIEGVFGRGVPAYAFRVARRHYAGFLGWSRWFHRGDDFPCLQLVWPDRAGRFPWETGFDAAFAGDQPDLSELGWAREIVG